MKKFFKKLFGIKPKHQEKPEWVNLPRDDKGRWIDSKHPSARKFATLDIKKVEGCCGGEGCKCKKSNS